MPIDVVENFIARGAGDKSASMQLLHWLKNQIKEGRADLAAEVLPRVLIPGLDYTTSVSLCRVLRLIRSARPTPNRAPKIAVLGSVTTHQLVEFLDLHLQSGRIHAEFYEADYGTINQEFLDSTSGLHRFQPDFIVIFTCWRDLKSRPSLTDGTDAVGRQIDAEIASWSMLWRVAREDLRCQVIQSNFAAPPWRVLGNMDAHHPAGFSRFISQVNQALVDRAPPGVTIHDVDRLAAESGRWEWSDERFFYQAKLPCSPEHLVDYSHSLAALLLAQLGAGRKCLVLDLDNTLWGGVIGDEGLRRNPPRAGRPGERSIRGVSKLCKIVGGPWHHARRLQQE